jgi:hypothetical protein
MLTDTQCDAMNEVLMRLSHHSFIPVYLDGSTLIVSDDDGISADIMIHLGDYVTISADGWDTCYLPQFTDDIAWRATFAAAVLTMGGYR